MANLRAVLTKPKISENYSRNAFDRSFSVNTSYQLGGLEPIFAEPVIAGSHIKLNRSIFQRTAPVNTAAFPKIDTHVEFFAVPLRLLWSYWNNFKLNIQDFNSNLMGTITSSASTYSFAPSTPALPYFNSAALNADIYNTIREYWHQAEYPNGYTSRYFGTYTDPQISAVGARRLLAAFGYGTVPMEMGAQPDPSTLTYMCNPFKLLAYQKVYYDHFRNTAYESNDPSFYNIDAYATAAELPDLLTARLCRYRYVNYRKDYFQSVYPSLNYVSSSPNGLSWIIPDSVLYKYTSGTDISSGTGSGGQTVLVFPQSSSTTNNFGTVQQLRASFALDKLLRASAYAPKHVCDQFEARYGVKGVESGKESVRIGAMMNDIIIQEVTNTAANLGQIGGKGVGYNGFGKDIEFTAKEDSIILAVMYSLPRTSYDGYGVMNWNTKLDREEFFIPEYMNLGLQPLYDGEISTMAYANGKPYMVGTSAYSYIGGYQSRYQEYKCGIDRNLGNFLAEGIYSDFTNHSQKAAFVQGFYGGLNADYFKVKPTDLDAVFASDTVVADPESDKFLTHLDIKFICNQNMSVHGQPSASGL